MSLKKYKCKESFTEAIQWTGENDDEILKLFNKDVSIDEERKWDDQKKKMISNKILYLRNSRHECTEKLEIGDYILSLDQTWMKENEKDFEDSHIMDEKEAPKESKKEKLESLKDPKPEEIVKCPHCNGRGLIYSDLEGGHCHSCQVCNESGKVTLKIKEAYEN